MEKSDCTKRDQTIYERAEIGERVVHEIRRLLQKYPVEVLGHLETSATCCRAGTVAIVKVDLDEVVNPAQRKK